MKDNWSTTSNYFWFCYTQQGLRFCYLVGWRGYRDLMEIDYLDSDYLFNHYIAKILSWLAKINTSLTQRLMAIEKLVSESVSRGYLLMTIFPSLIAQYW
jgi:hypothetical protein